MKLRDLLNGISILSFNGSQGEEIQGIAYSSKDVRQGWLFIALKGEKRDGFDFIKEAFSKGATTFISERQQPKDIKGNWIQVQDAREVLALCAANFYSHPSRDLNVIGITGTNGKTTVTYLVEEILKEAKLTPGVIGTISYRTPKTTVEAKLTTPEALELQKTLREMAGQGVTHCVIEVSSHSLDLKRVWGIDFDVVVFTNLSSEHLDYHHTMEEYFEAKKKLFFLNHSKKTAVVNIDDSWSKKLIPELPPGLLTYGLQEQAAVKCKNFNLTGHGIETDVFYPAGVMKIQSPLLGRPNLYNVLASIAIALTLNISPTAIEKGIKQCKKIPGRFEKIENSLGMNIYVDYAHTDDALRNLLVSFKELNPKRILLVFGAGGDRDRTKRKKMGKVSAEYADLIFLTSDNPRSEDPLAIIHEIEEGIKENSKKDYYIISDRREALEQAISFAEEGDYILVAGKGHEDYQILGDKTIHFSDTEVIKEILQEME